MTDIEKLEDIPEENEEVAKTPILGLHDWIGTDVVVREEFVEDNKKIDGFAGIVKSSIENLENEKLNITIFNQFKETIESEIGDLDDRFGIELTEIEDADLALKTGMYSINTKINTPHEKDGIVLVYAINKNDIVQEFIVSSNHTETYRRRYTGTFDNWTRTGITSKEAREDSKENLIVYKSNIIPPAIDGAIYLNTKDNFFYAAKDGQWYRVFLAGEPKLEQKAPTASPKLVSKTDTSITLGADSNMEFKYIGGTWQTSNTISGLSRNKTYSFQQRYKETDTYKASPASPSANYTTERGTQSAPSAPSVTGIKWDRVTVSGGNMVRLSNSNTWYDSPHTFTGLSEDTSYTAYAKYKETTTHKESPISTGRTIKTPVNIPGPENIKAGNKIAGFYGTVSYSEIASISDISSIAGFTGGEIVGNYKDWLKFSYNNKMLFMPIGGRKGIVFNELIAKNLVNGSKTVTVKGKQYKIRLISGLKNDMVDWDEFWTDRVTMTIDSEWNKLMIPLHKYANDLSKWINGDEYEKVFNTIDKNWNINMDNKSLFCGDTSSETLTRSMIKDSKTGELRVVNRNSQDNDDVNGKTNLHKVSYGSKLEDKKTRGLWQPVLELIE